MSLDGITFGGRSVDQIARAVERPRDPYAGIDFRVRHGFGVGLGAPRSLMRVTGSPTAGRAGGRSIPAPATAARRCGRATCSV